MKRILISLLMVTFATAIQARVEREQYENVLRRLQNTYAGEFREKGLKLVFERRYEDNTANAYTRVWGSKAIITLLGGIAKHPAINQEALALIGCHEIGRHLGGAPALPRVQSNNRFSSAGQAGYYATSKCFKRYLEAEDNIAALDDLDINQVAKFECENVYPDVRDAAICIRTAHASLGFARWLAMSQGIASNTINLHTRDRSVVDTTELQFPGVQCRLDIAFQGALCDKDAYEPASFLDPNIGYCSRSEGYERGVRPLCFYKPE